MQVIRQKEGEIEQVQNEWARRRERLSHDREGDEGMLRLLLTQDKQREIERIEREMTGLRDKFEMQVSAEDRWRNDLMTSTHWKQEWVCVFKPAMVARQEPSEGAQVTRRIIFNEVIKAKGSPNNEYWIQVEGSKKEYALTWHPKHGRLLQKWLGPNQHKLDELEAKIDERRKVRNQTFIDYKRKKKEVSEWAIPPGPSEEELKEIEDDEQSRLSSELAPILADLRVARRELRELRRRRLRDAAEQARLSAGAGAGDAALDLLSGLPMGFRVDGDDAETFGGAASSAAPPPTTSANTGTVLETQAVALSTVADHGGGSMRGVQAAAWEVKKRAADEAFARKEWHSALNLYSQALELGGAGFTALSDATLLSNRALVRARLDDWEGSFEDGREATTREPTWPKGWLRRATAELRLGRASEALESLKQGLASAGKTAGQFIGLVSECESALYSDQDSRGLPATEPEEPSTASGRIQKFREAGSKAFEQRCDGLAILYYTRALYHRAMMESRDEAVVLSNRAAAFLRLKLAREALADALAASEKDPRWSKPLTRAGQAATMMQDFKGSYQHFAKARRLDPSYPAANEGVNSCLQQLMNWEYPAAAQRWARFAVDRGRPRERLRIWALSDLYFDQHGAPEWCKSLSSTFFRDDVLMLAGNVADSLQQLRFGLTVLKSKFRRIFYVPGNQDLWVRRYTLQDMIRGDKVQDEGRTLGDSISKLLEVLQVCDDLGVETAPAEVAEGVFIVPLFSWYSRDFVPREERRRHASSTDAESKVTIDSWINWPFNCGADDAWRFLMRLNEPALRAALCGKMQYERFRNQSACMLTMTHFLTRSDLSFDWSIPGIWEHIGCCGLDEQLRAIGSGVHVYGHACTGARATEIEGVTYVHNYLGTADKHRPGMAPYCIFAAGKMVPEQQPTQENGFNFQPLPKPEEPPRARFGGG